MNLADGLTPEQMETALMRLAERNSRLTAALNDIILLDGKRLTGKQKTDHAITLAKRALAETR